MQLRKDSSVVFSANLAQLFGSLISGSVIARSLGPVGKGEVYLILQIISIGALLLSLGLGPSYQYHLRKELFLKSSIASHMIILLAITASGLALCYLLGISVLRHISGNMLSDALLLGTMILLALNVAALLLSSAAMALKDGVRYSSIYSVYGNMAYVGLLLLFVVRFKLGVLGAVLATGASVAFRIVLIARPLMKSIWHDLHWPPLAMHAPLFTYGIGALLGNLTLTGVLRVDTFLVNGYLGPAAVGVYSVAVAMGELLLMIPSSIGVALFPFLTSADRESQVSTMCHVARMCALLGIIGSIVVSLIGRPFIAILFGGRFSSSFDALLFLLPGLIAMTINFSFSNFFSSRGQPFLNAALFGMGAVVNVIANLWLIPKFGINGAAVSSSISYFLIACGFVIVIMKREKVRLQDLVIPGIPEVKLFVQLASNFLPRALRYSPCAE